MTVPMVDTDVILRLLTGDDPQKQVAAAGLFKQVRDGALTIAAPVSVIADAVFVLGSSKVYGFGRAQIAQGLQALVGLPNFRVEQRNDVLRALDLFATTNLDFGEALLIAAVERTGAPVLYSYDRDYDRIPSVHRREP